jgi:hypothetical protein
VIGNSCRGKISRAFYCASRCGKKTLKQLPVTELWRENTSGLSKLDFFWDRKSTDSWWLLKVKLWSTPCYLRKWKPYANPTSGSGVMAGKHFRVVKLDFFLWQKEYRLWSTPCCFWKWIAGGQSSFRFRSYGGKTLAGRPILVEACGTSTIALRLSGAKL